MNCEACKKNVQLVNFADRIMDEEKEVTANPFLATRIMASIEDLENRSEKKHLPVFQQIMRPVLVSISIAAAAFFGVLSGSMYQPGSAVGKIPVELSYMNDASLESIALFANIENRTDENNQ